MKWCPRIQHATQGLQREQREARTDPHMMTKSLQILLENVNIQMQEIQQPQARQQRIKAIQSM